MANGFDLVFCEHGVNHIRYRERLSPGGHEFVQGCHLENNAQLATIDFTGVRSTEVVQSLSVSESHW